MKRKPLATLRWGAVLVVSLMLAVSVLAAAPASAASGQRPSAPRHVTAVAGDTTATVTIPPPSNGGSRIIDYYIKVYPRRGATSAIHRCKTTRCKVLGLSNSLSYYFEVAAVNRFGVGPYSGGSNIVSPKAPTPVNVTITYVANATGASGSMASQTEPYGTTADLSLNAFTYTGYVFKCWSNTPGGSGSTFTNGELVKFTGNVTLYAIWSAGSALVTVTFEANAVGAVGTMAPEFLPYDVATALTGNAFIYSGYTLAGWATSPNGQAIYTNGSSVTLTTNLTLYAVWLENAPSFTGSTTPNWVGYVLPSATNSAVFTYVSGEWTVPTLNCADTPNNRSATWVGTGGFGWATGGTSGVLLQTGTEDDCSGGVQSDTGWFEIYPSTPNTQETFKDFPVSPGDTLRAVIEINTDDEWTTVLENLTTGLQGVFSVGYEWDVATIANNTLVGPIQGTATGTSYSGGDSAEWVVEDTGVAFSSSNYPFANFGTVTFSDLTTDLSSWTLPNSDAVEMAQGGVTLAVPGPVTNSSFTVTYTGP